ncbi:MAG: ABC transporter permease [Chitinophagaceae bacterium]|nr:ABC transporter permease [Chitinophagaceae bacterium]
MLKNFFKIAYRNLVKNKVLSFINITGLAIGLSCFLMIALYVIDELSYDRFYPNAGRIYRINSDMRFGGSEMNITQTSDMMGSLLKKDYPQVQEYTRLYTSDGSKLIKKGNEFINEQKVVNADSTFFTVFTLPAIAGDLKTCLNEPNTVVINESTAKKYFGNTNVVGKTIETKEDKNNIYKVTAVIKDIPHNSHLNFDFIFSMKNVDYQWGQLTSHNFHTYLLLKPGTDYKAFEKNFDVYVDRYVLPEVKQFMQIKSMDEFKKSGNKLHYSLMPLTKIHLYSIQNFEITPSGNIQYIYIFCAIAFFILLIACINFMNLTTARSANRAKEVGIRKVLGTERKELIKQFIFESVIVAFISLLIAIIIASLVLPLFNDVADKSMQVTSLFSLPILPLIFILPVLVGILAGSYPAFFLSAFRPIDVLKGKMRTGTKTVSLRSFLVVFQFATSIILIVGTIVIYRQLHYIQTKDIGYDKSQVLIIDNTNTLKDNVDAYKNKMLQQPGVTSTTVTSFLPVSESSRSDNTYSTETVVNTDNSLDMQSWRVDYEYLKTMGIQLKSGRNFSRDFGNDSSAVIINETTVQVLGFKEPLGKKIYSLGDPAHPKTYTIIGVVKNFNYESLHKSIDPLAIFLGKNNLCISLKVNAADIPAIIKQAGINWKDMAPGIPFSYRFLSDSFDHMYKAEQRVGKIAMIFSVLAIFIACLGLFGLATFIAEQRTKEIGIRKVLGASVKGIVEMLSRDFIKLVIISFIISAPLAWFIMNKWLQDFVYRINLSWWIFGIAGISALSIALFTVSFQAIKAAIANPVKSLRTE